MLLGSPTCFTLSLSLSPSRKNAKVVNFNGYDLFNVTSIQFHLRPLYLLVQSTQTRIALSLVGWLDVFIRQSTIYVHYFYVSDPTTNDSTDPPMSRSQWPFPYETHEAQGHRSSRVFPARNTENRFFSICHFFFTVLQTFRILARFFVASNWKVDDDDSFARCGTFISHWNPQFAIFMNKFSNI